MNRRGFLSLLTGAVAGVVLDQAIPFNRVWSFPSQIVIPSQVVLTGDRLLTIPMITREMLAVLQNNLVFMNVIQHEEFDANFKVGSVLSIRKPPRYLEYPERLLYNTLEAA